MTSDEAVKAALRVWFGRDQEYAAGLEALMRAAIEAALDVEIARFRVTHIDAGRLICERHGPPPTSQSGVSRNPRTGAR